MFPFTGQRRLVVAFALSLLLHLLLLLGVAVRPMPPSGPVLSAATVNVTLPAPQRPAAMSPPLQPLPAAAAEQLPQPAPQPVAQPVQSAVAEHSSQPASLPDAAPREEPTILPAIDVPLIHDPVFYPARQVDVHPSALVPINPAYPDAAAERNVTGKVILLLLIDEGGKVVDVSVVEATPPGYFEDAAVAAFRSARFSPAEKGGRKVKSRVLIQVSFELENLPARLLP